MNKYIHFTEEEKERARSADLVAFLEGRGERLRRTGSEYLWPDRHITIKGHIWYDQYTQEGGSAVDFVMREYGVTFQDAVMMLIQGNAREAPHRQPMARKRHDTQKAFVLPEANSDMKRVYAYLVKTRGIDAGVVSFFAKRGLIYEEAEYHNAVFIGLDENGVTRHAHKRSTLTARTENTRWNAAGSDSAYSFHHIGTSEYIYTFEAPIDMLSFITMHKGRWRDHSYVSLCSVSDRALMRLLESGSRLRTPIICLDSDTAGLVAAGRIWTKLKENGYAEARIESPALKDWNEDLLALRAMRGKSVDENQIKEMEEGICQGISQG